MHARRPRIDLALIAAVSAVAATGCATTGTVSAQSQEGPGPIFVDGQAQVVPEFQDPTSWIRQDLWVETEFDSDGDGRPDRVHVDVTRPGQTDTEGLRVPVVYESSPYYSGTGTAASEFFWDIRQEVGTEPRVRNDMPGISTARSNITNGRVMFPRHAATNSGGKQ